MMDRCVLDTERVLCTIAELGEQGCRGFTLGEGDWPLRGFVLRVGQEYRAYLNSCPHAGHPLNLRPHQFLTPDGTLIICCSHGALFERAGGLCIAGPCEGKALRSLPVEVVSGYVLLADGVPLASPV